MSKFNFFIDSEIPEEVYKSASKAKDSRAKYNNMVVFGRATTNIKDRQAETLEPSGFLIDEFLSDGLVNLEHNYVRKGDPSAIIGEPIDAYIKDDAFFVKAKLYKGHKTAEALWDTLLLMKENGSKRKLGWSIEGKSLEKDPMNKKRITKAKIKNIALTFSPVGYNTYADIAKGEQSKDYVEPVWDEKTTNGNFLLRQEVGGKVITVNKDWSVDIKEKSMDTGSLKPLIKESLSKKTLDLGAFSNIFKAYKEGNIDKKNLKTILNRCV